MWAQFKLFIRALFHFCGYAPPHAAQVGVPEAYAGNNIIHLKHLPTWTLLYLALYSRFAFLPLPKLWRAGGVARAFFGEEGLPRETGMRIGSITRSYPVKIALTFYSGAPKWYWLRGQACRSAARNSTRLKTKIFTAKLIKTKGWNAITFHYSPGVRVPHTSGGANALSHYLFRIAYQAQALKNSMVYLSLFIVKCPYLLATILGFQNTCGSVVLLAWIREVWEGAIAENN